MEAAGWRDWAAALRSGLGIVGPTRSSLHAGSARLPVGGSLAGASAALGTRKADGIAGCCTNLRSKWTGRSIVTRSTQPRVTISSYVSREAEQFVVRNSETKLETKLRCGFLVGLEFRNPPEFRFLRNSLFWKRETKLFFFEFRKRNSETNSNAETSLVSGFEFRIRVSSPKLKKKQFRFPFPEQRIAPYTKLGWVTKLKSHQKPTSSFVSEFRIRVSCDELFSLRWVLLWNF